ncbi:MAG TPA: hypothetical protein VG939_15915, partial [Caulobacteraceae bacterium]|nr:hypothetical protein [Caulobacteraceae bacterium]
TLARRLGERFGLPVIHLDRLGFGPGWRRVSEEVLGERLEAALGEAWVVDGTYGAASAITLPRADLVLWLEAPAWLRLLRCWRKVRAHRGRDRADRPDGCEEAFGWSYAVTVLGFGRWSEGIGRRIAAAAPQAVVMRLSAREAVRLFPRLHGEGQAMRSVARVGNRDETPERQPVSAGT